MITSDEIRKQFLNFWTSKPRNSKLTPNVSLVPNVDSTLLFVNSGMFPLAPYLSGQPHPLGKRLCNIQRCLRTNYDEMIEVGDNRHTLMFEMLGNWSIGDFTKKEQIPWTLELHVKVFKLDPSRIYVSVWAGDELVAADNEAIELWKKAFAEYGVAAEFTTDITRIPETLAQGKNHNYRIFPFGRKKNWWQRGSAPGELGGPTTEMFYDLGVREREQETYHINDDSGRFIEIGNNVFMEYQLDKDMQWQSLPQKNIDYGGGFERLGMCIQEKLDIFESDLYEPIIKKISELSGKPYKNDGIQNNFTSYFRILADHARAATFILADGVTPSNKDQGYILRRFIRRMVRFAAKLSIEKDFTAELAKSVVNRMSQAYPHLKEQQETILDQISREEAVFRKTLARGLKEIAKIKKKQGTIDGQTAFYIYETYGFPIELTLDEFTLNEAQAENLLSDFQAAEKQHRAKSKLGEAKKFSGGLADHSQQVVKLHTAHHLLLKALQTVLGNDVKQRGSNITADRLRLDFKYSEKLSQEQLEKVTALVNQKISEDLKVERREMPRAEAEKIGAEMEFGQKYPQRVSVYFIWEKDGKTSFSKEFCGGPHVAATGELAENNKKFKILKQENIGGGLRRIKANLE